MKVITTGTRCAPRSLRGSGLALLAAAGFALAACGTAGPAPALYVLGAPPAAATATTPQAGLSTVEVKPVQLPGYLDTTDIVVRGGSGQVIPSQAGRWGERLSEGLTRALAMGLAARLPRVAVTATSPVERPAEQVLVDVESFEARTDGQVLLVARWSVTDGATRETLVSERTSLAVPVQDAGDPSVVVAMNRAVEDFADRVAAGIERAAPVAQARR